MAGPTGRSGPASHTAEPAPIVYLPWVAPSASQAGAVNGAFGSVDGDGSTQTELERGIAADDRADALVLRKLARHGLTEREVRAELAVELSPGDVERAVERYQRLGYIDDERLAEAYVRGTAARKQLAAAVIRRNLLARGVDSEIVARVLTELDAAMEFDHAVASASRRLARSSLPREVLTVRLVAQLERKGYSRGLARKAVEAAFEARGNAAPTSSRA